MKTIQVVAHNRHQAERWCRGFDCPAVTAFVDDWEEAGSCRFVGHDSTGSEVSVLILASARPSRCSQWVPDDSTSS